jgi:hypothetical protein
MGLIIFIGPFFSIVDKVDRLNTFKTGHIVHAILTEIPNTYNAHELCVFRYEDKRFTKHFPESFCTTHKTGDTVDFLYNSKNQDIFEVPASEDIYYLNIFCAIIISFLGLYILLNAAKVRESFKNDNS